MGATSVSLSHSTEANLVIRHPTSPQRPDQICGRGYIPRIESLGQDVNLGNLKVGRGCTGIAALSICRSGCRSV